MGKPSNKILRRSRIRRRIRTKIKGSADRPRLSIFRSNRQIYAQIIDDDKGVTLASCSSRLNDVNSQPLSKTEQSRLVGQKLAEIAKTKGIEQIIFDRGGYKYHGRIKALAEGVREGGLIF